jgi:hypothetical protein
MTGSISASSFGTGSETPIYLQQIIVQIDDIGPFAEKAVVEEAGVVDEFCCSFS